MVYLLIFFRVLSLALGQSYDCPSACEVTLKYLSEIRLYYTSHQVQSMHISWDELCMQNSNMCVWVRILHRKSKNIMLEWQDTHYSAIVGRQSVINTSWWGQYVIALRIWKQRVLLLSFIHDGWDTDLVKIFCWTIYCVWCHYVS